MSKELKAFRKICKNLNSYEFTDEYKKNKKLIEKSLKALEIIEKYVYVRKPYEKVYEICFNDESEMITEEEYELLKEVLKWAKN